MVESIRIMPPGTTVSTNLSKEGLFITIRQSGLLTMGEPMGSSLRMTLQFAVPPRISGP